MFLPHFDAFCDLLLNRRTATWVLFVLYNKETNITDNAFFLFQNHATVKPDSSVAPRGMKTYSESKIELRNLQILKEMLGK